MFQLLHPTVATQESVKSQCAQLWDQLFNREDIGFLKLTEREELWASSQERAKQVKDQFSRHIVLGMGGSSLGGQALCEALRPNGGHSLEFWDNIDARDIHLKLESLTLEEVHWIIISKSGGTMETLAMANFAAQKCQSLGIDFTNHCTVITEARSNPLYNWAGKHEVPVLEIPLDVGGRFSVLTPVGLLPAALLGLDMDKLNQGAHWALGQKDLICEWAAQSLQSFKQELWITLFWSYSERMCTLGLWFQQLWAESLAKKRKINGGEAPRVSSPFVVRGASDQHSILQQVAEGYKDKFIFFLRDQESEDFGPVLEANLFAGQDMMLQKTLGALMRAEAQATQRALAEEGIPSLTLEVKRMDEVSMGALFMGCQLLVGVMGEALEINTYDQPGVEAGKRLARQIMTS
jgi:glucose-6-phosphate isomerase